MFIATTEDVKALILVVVNGEGILKQLAIR